MALLQLSEYSSFYFGKKKRGRGEERAAAIHRERKEREKKSIPRPHDGGALFGERFQRHSPRVTWVFRFGRFHGWFSRG